MVRAEGRLRILVHLKVRRVRQRRVHEVGHRRAVLDHGLAVAVAVELILRVPLDHRAARLRAAREPMGPVVGVRVRLRRPAGGERRGLRAQRFVLRAVVGGEALINDRIAAGAGVVHARNLTPSGIAVRVGWILKAVPVEAGVDAVEAGDAGEPAGTVVAIRGELRQTHRAHGGECDGLVERIVAVLNDATGGVGGRQAIAHTIMRGAEREATTGLRAEIGEGIPDESVLNAAGRRALRRRAHET